MNGYEITLIILLGVALLLNAYGHGKPKDGENNFWISLVALVIQFGLMYGAGLFR